MGNVFSKKHTIKDRLLFLENVINKNEYELSSLKLSGSFGNMTYSFIISTSFVFFFLYIFDLFQFLDYGIFGFILCIIIFLLALIFYYLLCFSKARLITKKQKLIEEMKIERKKLVELCKNDMNYSLTKSIIEKYEEDESRSTYFDQVLRKKKSTLDSVSNFVLGSDPEVLNALICVKCGHHNGLIDPKNDDFKIFYCFHCREKNIRKNHNN